MTKTMKKILSVCLVVLMCMTAAPLDGFVGLDLGFGTKASALDASGSLGENINYTFDSTTGALAITGSGDMSDCSQYASPFWNNRDIKSVTIDENITSIGNYLFNETTLLESVTLPTTIKKIGKGAFMYTYSLKSINLPEGLETIGESAFENCVKIESVTIPKSVKNIGDGAFTCCKELTGFTVDADNENYTCVDGVLFNKTKTELICYPQGKIGESYAIPAGVETIAKNAFNNNWNIKSVTMTNDVKTIGESAFSYCIYLTSVTLSNKLTTIGKSAFFGCSFENIVIPEGVTKIGDYAFAACSNLKTVVLPSTLKQIESYAFYNDSALSDVYYFGTEETWDNITIDSSNDPLKNAKRHYVDATKKIGDNVYYEFDSATGALTIFGSGDTYDYSFAQLPFAYDSSIKSVTIGEGVTSIGNMLFYMATSLKSASLPTTLKKIGNVAFRYTRLESITLPENLEIIGERAFACCDLKSVTIPKSVKTIDSTAFYDCSDLSGITVDSDNANYTSVDGVLFNKAKTELVCYPGGKTSESYAIPAGVEVIAGNAFAQNSNLKLVTMTNDVKTIGESAFMGCDLTSVTLSNKLTTIPQDAFSNCKFESIVIPEGVTKIESSAFLYCSNLKTVVLPSTLTDIKQGAFSNDNALSDVYYASTEEMWNSIDINAYNNAPLINANIIFNHIHSVSNYVVVKNGTCENGGTKNGMCVCGMCVETETISTAHTFGTVQHKDADCLNTGYDYKQCTDCKKYFASDAAANATNGKDDTSSFVIPATGHSDGKDGNDNLCDKCRAYIGNITLTVGTNITVPITYAYGSRDTLVKFVPDKTAQYIISSNADLDDQNTYPTMTVYSLTNGTLKYVDYAAGGIGENFNLSTATFIEGQVYCIAFRNYKENAEAYTVNVALGCEHPSTKQTCIGYYCEVCGLYYGSRDSSKHELDTVQTCSGYKCKHCNRYFGDAAPDNHIWDTDGMCTACYTWHDHKTFDENGMCTVCKYALPYVLISGTTKTYYGAFTDALTAAKDGDTIKMQNDDASSYSSVEITKAITLDLNGHFLTQPSSASFAVKANVTFTDSVGGSYCEYGIVLYTSCTFSGGGYRYIAISTDFETEDNLGDYLAACCDYYNYSFGFYDGVGVGTVGSLLDLSSRKNTYNLENGIMIKANHSTVTVSAQEATCTKAGHTAGEYCENCDYTTVTKAGEPTGHTFGAAQHKDADCTSGGYDYKQCSSCKKYFAPDAATNATNGKSDYSSFTTQKLNHSYTGDIKNDGDGKNGTHSFKCVNGCGQYGNATAHEWNNGEITTPATHLKEGVKTFECTCGATYTEPVSKLEGHTYTPTVVPPTCTEQGYVEHKCACGDSYKDTYVDAAGHNYENGSCTECSDKDPNYTGDQGGNTGDNTSDCDCICHSSNKFVQFFYKIIRWFWKLFKIHKTCDCGAIHY